MATAHSISRVGWGAGETPQPRCSRLPLERRWHVALRPSSANPPIPPNIRVWRSPRSLAAQSGASGRRGPALAGTGLGVIERADLTGKEWTPRELRPGAIVMYRIFGTGDEVA
jgi:hypothetical protein